MNTYVLYDITNIIIGASNGYGKDFNYYGFPTGGLYTLFDIMSKHGISNEEDNGVYHILCFDSKGKKIKKSYFNTYKANRPEANPLSRSIVGAQINWIKDMARDTGMIMLEKEGYEADDMLYSSVYNILKFDKDAKFVIVSTDSDFASLELLSENITFEKLMGHKISREPTAIVNKIVYGDSSDNIKAINDPNFDKKTMSVAQTRLMLFLCDMVEDMLKPNIDYKKFYDVLDAPEYIKGRLAENVFLVCPLILENIVTQESIDKINEDRMIDYINALGMKKILKKLFKVDRDYNNKRSIDILYKALYLLDDEVISHFENKKYCG